MREIPVFKDARLLEALDYIDRDLIAEVVNDIKAPDADEIPGQNKKAVWRSVKHALLLAASLVLISAFIPIVTYISQHTEFFPGSNPSGSNTDNSNIAEATAAIHEGNETYPLFTPDLEPISDRTISLVKGALYDLINNYEREALRTLKENDPSYKGKENRIWVEACNQADQLAYEISSYLFSANKKDHFIGRYYGTINGCVIFALNTHLEGENNMITINGIPIKNDNSFYLFAYRDSKVEELATAYDEGWLRDEDIKKIKERHDQFNAYAYWEDSSRYYTYAKFTDDLEELSDDMIDEIRADVFAQRYSEYFAVLFEKNQTYKDVYTDRRIREMSANSAYLNAEEDSQMFIKKEKATIRTYEDYFRYYGIFGDNVIWANVGLSVGNNMTKYYFYGHELSFDEISRIYVYNNGRILDLADANLEGLLTKADFEKLYERYVAYNEYLDSPRASESETDIPTISFPDNMRAADLYTEVMNGNWLVRDGSSVISGEGLDKEFYEKATKGEPASLNIAIYNENSPSEIHLEAIVYNGEYYELLYQYRQNGKPIEIFRKRFKYIIRYEGEEINQGIYLNRFIESYLLVNDNTLTYEKVMSQMDLYDFYHFYISITPITNETTN